MGEVTSGCPSPCLGSFLLFDFLLFLSLGKNIGIAYVDAAHAKDGTEIVLDFGSKKQNAVVSKMPFLKTTYYTGK